VLVLGMMHRDEKNDCLVFFNHTFSKYILPVIYGINIERETRDNEIFTLSDNGSTDWPVATLPHPIYREK